MSDKALRQEVIETALAMAGSGLSKGTSGNVSVRTDGGCLITPSGVPYDELKAIDIVELDLHGNVLNGDLRPSSEWPFHTAIYRIRPEAGAIVHCHSLYATVVAAHGLCIPAFHYMIALAGGTDIRCAEYATFGTEALSDQVLEAIDGRLACLLAHHGQVAFGSDPAAALQLAEQVEELAAQYWIARQQGDPPLLSDQDMNEVLSKFDDYGKQPRGR